MSRGLAPRKLKTFDDDDIVRYSMGPDVPIVGLVRDRSEYKEMREMALITGTILGLNRRERRAPEASAPDAAPAAATPTEPAPTPADDRASA